MRIWTGEDNNVVPSSILEYLSRRSKELDSSSMKVEASGFLRLGKY
jgi:hypothetical protein